MLEDTRGERGLVYVGHGKLHGYSAAQLLGSRFRQADVPGVEGVERPRQHGLNTSQIMVAPPVRLAHDRPGIAGRQPLEGRIQGG
jgi:hypothetical protein